MPLSDTTSKTPAEILCLISDDRIQPSCNKSWRRCQIVGHYLLADAMNGSLLSTSTLTTTDYIVLQPPETPSACLAHWIRQSLPAFHDGMTADAAAPRPRVSIRSVEAPHAFQANESHRDLRVTSHSVHYSSEDRRGLDRLWNATSLLLHAVRRCLVSTPTSPMMASGRRGIASSILPPQPPAQAPISRTASQPPPSSAFHSHPSANNIPRGSPKWLSRSCTNARMPQSSKSATRYAGLQPKATIALLYSVFDLSSAPK